MSICIFYELAFEVSDGVHLCLFLRSPCRSELVLHFGHAVRLCPPVTVTCVVNIPKVQLPLHAVFLCLSPETTTQCLIMSAPFLRSVVVLPTLSFARTLVPTVRTLPANCTCVRSLQVLLKDGSCCSDRAHHRPKRTPFLVFALAVVTHFCWFLCPWKGFHHAKKFLLCCTLHIASSHGPLALCLCESYCEASGPRFHHWHWHCVDRVIDDDCTQIYVHVEIPLCANAWLTKQHVNRFSSRIALRTQRPLAPASARCSLRFEGSWVPTISTQYVCR